MSAGVSVVIPAYNAEAYIARAIESVLRQDFERDVQIIVVDDGSRDDTARIVSAFEPRVRLIAQANGGVSSARNTGLAAADYEFVALLDADDMMSNRRLREQYAALQSRPNAVFCCSSKEIISEADTALAQQPKMLTTSYMEGQQLARRLFHNNFITTSSVMLRKSAAEAVGGFEKAFSHSEDLDMWLRLSRTGDLIVLSERLAKYRHHEDQSVLNTLAMARGRFEVRERFLREQAHARSWLGEHVAAEELSRYAISYGYGLILNRQARRAVPVHLRSLRHCPKDLTLWRHLSGALFRSVQQWLSQPT